MRKVDIKSDEDEAIQQHGSETVKAAVPDSDDPNSAADANQSVAEANTLTAPELLPDKTKETIKRSKKITVLAHEDLAVSESQLDNEATDTEEQNAPDRSPEAFLAPTAPEISSDDLDTSVMPEAQPPDITDVENPELIPPKKFDKFRPMTNIVPHAPVPDVDSPDTDKAVEDIVSKESDEVLAMEDSYRAEAQPVRTTPTKIRRHRKLAWRLIIFGFLAALSAAAGWPTSRYKLLNTVGVQAASSLIILDQSTQQPLKGVQVSLGGVSGQTDASGLVKVDHLRLGKLPLIVRKSAFADSKQVVTIGWGSNPLGNFSLTPTGRQYVFSIVDYVSAKPVVKVTASTGREATALSDNKGKIKLTTEAGNASALDVSIEADGYRDETIHLAAEQTSEQIVRLVPSGKDVYVVKRSGKYDVYSIDIDGKNEELLLLGTGLEHDDMKVVISPNFDTVAVASTRDDKRGADNNLLTTLTLINMSDKSVYSVAQSEQIQIVGWAGQKLVYAQIAAGSGPANPARQRLVSFDSATRATTQLASANYFNSVLSANGTIYYAPAKIADDDANSQFFSVKADGSDRQVVLPQETWNAVRSAYSKLAVFTPGQWYDFALGDKQAAKAAGAPPSLVSRIYIDSPDGKQSSWVDKRDGKTVLMNYDILTKQDTPLLTQIGISAPVRWLQNRAIIYRLVTPQETADYVLSFDGGESVKIRDVVNVGSVDGWYHY